MKSYFYDVVVKDEKGNDSFGFGGCESGNSIDEVERMVLEQIQKAGIENFTLNVEEDDGGDGDDD